MAEEVLHEYLDEEGLKYYHSKVNDMTTGINLIPGSRDLQPLTGPGDYTGYVSASSLFKIEKDEQGYSNAVITIENQSGGLYFWTPYANVVPKSGDTYTIGFEIWSDNYETIDGLVGYISYRTRATGIQTTTKEIRISDKEELIDGTWHQIKMTVTVGDEKGADSFILGFRSAGSGTIKYRKPFAYVGVINNPIWAPSPSDFVMGPINDMTTGINLLRGTRDFRIGTEKGTLADFYFDGFYLSSNGPWTIEKDEDGFGVISIKRSGLSSSSLATVHSSLIACKPSDVFTLSFDFMTPDKDAIDDKNIVSCIFYSDQYSQVSTVSSFPTTEFDKVSNDVFCRLTQKITIPADCAYFSMRLRLGRNGELHFKRLKVERGSISHPIWSASPFDVPDVGSSVNDLTTGINLLRETRDFKSGSGAKTVDAYTNGWAINQPQYWQVKQIPNDYSVLTVTDTANNSTVDKYANSNLIFNIKKNHVYTLFGEIRVETAPNEDTVRAIGIIPITETNTAQATIHKTFKDLKVPIDRTGEWIPFVTTFMITSDVVDKIFIRASFNGSGSISYRKFGLYDGDIHNPVWAPSPLDLAMGPVNDITTGINLLRGTRNFELSTTKHPTLTNRYVNGFYTTNVGWTYSKDKDGFAIAHIEASDLSTDSLKNLDYYYFGLKPNTDYTVFFDFMCDDIEQVTPNKSVVIAMLMDEATNNAISTVVGFDPTKVANFENKAWNTYSFTFNTGNNENAFLLYRLALPRNGSLYFKKTGLYEGNIQHPEWSQSPFDVALLGDLPTEGNIKELKDKVDAINDYTTEINLLRGTRDFTSGTKFIGTSKICEDGCYLSSGDWKIEEDDNGFKRLTVGREATGSSNWWFRCSAFKRNGITKLTVSGELKIITSVVANQRFIRAVGLTSAGTETSQMSASIGSIGIDTSKVGEWQPFKYVFDVTSISESDYIFVDLAYETSVTGFYSVRKITANAGEINHPIWSPSPADLALEPVNDITTGINLLRGTRDFTTFTKRTDNTFPDDGFSLGSATLETDQDGFTIAKIPVGGVIYSSLARKIKSGQTYTIAFDFRFENPPSGSGTISNSIAEIFVRGNNNESKSSFGITFSNLGIKELPTAGEWIHVVYRYTVGSFTEDVHLGITIRANAFNTKVQYKKFCIYEGNIQNPEWSASPFDYVSSSIEAGKPLMLGKRKEIPADSDLNDYKVFGSYSAVVNSVVTTLLHRPEGLNNAFTLDVSSPQGLAYEETGNQNVRQILTVYNVDAATYIRYYSANNSTWSEWKQTYVNTPVKPIEGGGTGWVHGLNSGINIVPGTSSEWSEWIEPQANAVNVTTFLPGMTVSYPLDKSPGDVYTSYIEIEFDNVTAVEGQPWTFQRLGQTDSKWNNTASPWSESLSEPALTEVPENNKVYRLKKIKEITDFSGYSSYSTFSIGFRCDYWASGRFRYRCLKIERGRVDYPEWSPAPEDLEKINDVTTGINLVKGSRDFNKNTKTASYNSGVPLDGFYIPATSGEKICTLDTDEEGFTVVTLNRKTYETGGDIPVRSSAIPCYDKTTFTASFEYKPESDFIDSTSNNILMIQEFNGVGANPVRSITYMPDKQSMAVDQWNKCTYTFEVTGGENHEIIVILHLTNVGTISFRKLCVYEGCIQNPEWTANPFDVASSYDWNNGAPSLLGTAKEIHQGDDLDAYRTAGSYSFHGDSEVSSVKNKPEGLSKSFKLDVIYSTGKNSDILRQVLTVYDESAIQYIRYRQANMNSGNWYPWRQTYANTTVRPIEGGGTGRNDGLSLGVAGRQLQTGEDLNTFLKTGHWYSGSTAITTSLLHTPIKCNHCTLDVTSYANPGSSDGPSWQVFTGTNNDNNIRSFIRLVKPGVQSDWFEILTSMSPDVTELESIVKGTYKGQNLATKFESEIGSTPVATWLQNRVKAANFSGLNIKDYVDIDCDGQTMRYRIAAIDPYYHVGRGNGQINSHHIAMVPDEPWLMSEAKDGEYSAGGKFDWIRWSKSSSNTVESIGTSGGSPYIDSNLHKWENDKMLSHFPQEWQNAMLEFHRLIEIRQSLSEKLTESNGTNNVEFGKIWSLSEMEVFGTVVWGTKGYSMANDCHFPIFAQSHDRVERGNHIGKNWWLRTLASNSSTDACYISDDGHPETSTVNGTEVYPLPCFMIG